MHVNRLFGDKGFSMVEIEANWSLGALVLLHSCLLGGDIIECIRNSYLVLGYFVIREGKYVYFEVMDWVVIWMT